MDGYNNNTLMHDAASSNSTSCLKVLLRLAPHLLDADSVFNETPLMWAVMFDRRDATKLLLGAGADIRAKNLSDITVFDRALNEEMLDLLKQHQQVVEYFNSFK